MLASVKAEHLLDTTDFFIWRDAHCSSGNEVNDDGMDEQQFEALSCRAWTTTLLQVYKVFVLHRITATHFIKANSEDSRIAREPFNRDPLCSNVYTTSERVILAWLSQHYNEQRTNSGLVENSLRGRAPLSRWIVNFDYDLMDGLVFAALLYAYVPCVACSHLRAMYTQPATAEQCLHNALKICSVVRHLGLDYDIVATDITEPNSVNLMLFCVYLYRRLPHYIPKMSVNFVCTLHSSVTKQIKLQNPSSKPLLYTIAIVGQEASDFSCGESNVQVPPKGETIVNVTYRNRFIHRCSAVVMFVGKRVGSPVGSTLAFALHTVTQSITSQGSLACSSPCYDQCTVSVQVQNPFKSAGTFQIVLVETKAEDKKTSGGKKGKTSKILQAKLAMSQSQLSNHDVGEYPVKTPDTGDEITFKSFWCERSDIELDPDSRVSLDIHFLPFAVGLRQCSVLFINQSVGEFVYSIEGRGLAPLPMHVPIQNESPATVAAEHEPGDIVGSQSNGISMKCHSRSGFSRDIKLYCTNRKRESALLIAAMQSMSTREQHRRELTGATSANTVASTLSALVLTEGSHVDVSPIKASKNTDVTHFTVRSSSSYFKTRENITVPNYSHDNNETFDLPVEFIPDGPGQYSALIELSAPNDIRVFRMESTLNPDHTVAELEFTCQAHKSVLQEIPVINNSNSDWYMTVDLNAEAFKCAGKFTAERSKTTLLPLVFSPSHEANTRGTLKLINSTNGSEMAFMLLGNVLKPDPMGKLEFECTVNEMKTFIVDVPNNTGRKMVFKVYCDIACASGASLLSILPSHTGKLKVNILPKKRGYLQGTLSFVADDSLLAEITASRDISSDTSSDEEDFRKVHEVAVTQRNTRFAHPSEEPLFDKPYRLLYQVAVNAMPAAAVNQFVISCDAREVDHLLIPLENPTASSMELTVVISGEGLSGDEATIIPPKSMQSYLLKFAPVRAGELNGSVVFQSQNRSEFWYEIILKAEQPTPIAVPVMECPLGRSCTSVLRVDNPLDHHIVMTVNCSNPFNFHIDDTQVSVDGNSWLDIPVTYTPSRLGTKQQEGQLFFESEELGEVVYRLRGIGLVPVASEQHLVQTELGGSSSTVVTFTNPFQCDVEVSVTLQPSPSSIHQHGEQGEPSSDLSSFCLMLRRPNSIRLAARRKLNIPLSFSPSRMRRYQCSCVVLTRSLVASLSVHMDNNERIFQWEFPITGLSVCSPLAPTQAAHVQCSARKRVEEKVEVVLDMNARHSNDNRCSTPIHLLGDFVLASATTPKQGVLVDSFQYQLVYDSDEASRCLDDALAFHLLDIRCHDDASIVSLIFSAVFAPQKLFSQLVTLRIQASTGGVWTFPFRFTASTPDPDDVIHLEATGLNKTSAVGFRLTSQRSEPLSFEAGVLGGSNEFFSVSPARGLLPAADKEGLLITISYTPKSYGKEHRTVLMIETGITQWSYDIRGSVPSYSAPNVPRAIDCDNEAYQVNKRRNSPKKNFVKSNLCLTSTGVSSPIKGLSLVKQL